VRKAEVEDCGGRLRLRWKAEQELSRAKRGLARVVKSRCSFTGGISATAAPIFHSTL